MLKWVAQNKYKLMASIIGLYLATDIFLHKGQTRVLLPNNFPEFVRSSPLPQSKSTLINKNKSWKKDIDTREQMDKLNTDLPGFECDVYFDIDKNIFDVYHDPGKSKGLNLDDLLQLYLQRKMSGSIWLDVKNLKDANSKSALALLTRLRSKYKLQNKILVESARADLLTAFSDSAFYTSYYIPFFNPYKINNSKTKFWVDSISAVIIKSRVNALSGYYFQYSFLSYYFPQYPVLTWVDHSSFSLVNYLFQRKIDADKSIFIALKP
jgi:hypothetical protein